MLKKITIGCVGVLLSVNTAFAKKDTIHEGKVLEFKDAGSYTYVKIQDKDKNYWAAVPATKVIVGETIKISEQMWMTNFKSTALNRTFEKVMFAEMPNAKKAIHGTNNVHGIHGQMTKGEKPNPKFDEIVISKDKPIKTTIAKLFEKKDAFKNKNVQIQGEVVQVSNKVLGNTWVKIKGTNDSIIFRSPNADEKVKKGDKVEVIGTINTDVDYGYGFKYQIIGVNAKFTKL
ncbi:hypothetical protein AMRN_0785 [Malaciobacter marinus]|uniref:GW domain-containing protein n=1 Tax=Malaciobacter marinus TaxID=505249 RepID=A0A347TIW0_9BACT|nr:GW dipeptide domain-containing protein [Malaciobacter marinus]AXX86538.1 hypothetical protein AMRN_0785 [Malaciobacter marinus]PHO11447.1 hypothetical protein CPG38_13020 [Malaciobacter marinus]PHO14194.1 hypothetical protein CPH92_13100 [Malaciobacter marinus]